MKNRGSLDQVGLRLSRSRAADLLPIKPGFTCCQDEADNNPISQLSRRIDLVLTLGKVVPLGAALIGGDPRSRTPDGLWPSDHAELWLQV